MKSTHAKQKSPKMEQYKLNTIYAVTLSPPDRRTMTGAKMIKGNELETYKNLMDSINEDIQYFKKLKYCSLELYTELSNNGRLHYHGYIQIKDILKFTYHDLHLLNQISYEIDTMSEDSCGIYKYEQYVLKQKELWKPFIEYESMQYPIKIH